MMPTSRARCRMHDGCPRMAAGIVYIRGLCVATCVNCWVAASDRHGELVLHTFG